MYLIENPNSISHSLTNPSPIVIYIRPAERSRTSNKQSNVANDERSEGKDNVSF